MKNITDAMEDSVKKGDWERSLVLVYQETNCPHPNSQRRRKHAVKTVQGNVAENTC